MNVSIGIILIETEAPLNIDIPPYQYRESHAKGNTVSRPSSIYDENICNRKTVLISKLDPVIRHQHDHYFVDSSFERHNQYCSTNHSSADRISGQFLFYHDHNLQKVRETCVFRCLVPLFVPIGVCVTTHDDGTASDVTIGM